MKQLEFLMQNEPGNTMKKMLTISHGQWYKNCLMPIYTNER